MEATWECMMCQIEIEAFSVAALYLIRHSELSLVRIFKGGLFFALTEIHIKRCKGLHDVLIPFVQGTEFSF